MIRYKILFSHFYWMLPTGNNLWNRVKWTAFTLPMLENSTQICTSAAEAIRKPSLKLSCKTNKANTANNEIAVRWMFNKAYKFYGCFLIYTLSYCGAFELSNQTLQNWFYVQTRPSAVVCRRCEVMLCAIFDINSKTKPIKIPTTQMPIEAFDFGAPEACIHKTNSKQSNNKKRWWSEVVRCHKNNLPIKRWALTVCVG